MFAFKMFQRDALARMAIPDGAVLAAMPGLGKSCMGIAWGLLKVGLHPRANGTLLPAEPILIVAPAGLYSQMCEDYRGLFGAAMPPVTRINSQQTLARILAANGGHLPAGWYFSSYTEVAMNKMQILPDVPEEDLPANMAKAYTDYFGVETMDECRRIAREAAVGLGEERNGIRCVYKPALAELLKDLFAAVIIDEATHVKSEDSIIGMGVRTLRPRYRAALSGTPAKNHLSDVLFLAAWSCASLDEPTDRWEHNNIAEFKKAFNVMSVNRTQEERARLSPGRLSTAPRRTTSHGIPIAEVSNVQKLWRTLAPVILRLRKSDIGAEIVPKIYRTITVPFGQEQARVYQHHLTVPMFDQRGMSSVIARITNLRKCACAPASESLGKVRGEFSFTPKAHACMEIVRAVLRRQEQVVIFSPYRDPLDVLSGYLSESGIPHDVLDGRLSASKRAVLAANFKAGLAGGGNPVMLAGLKAMSEGFSFQLANNVVLYARDHALDLQRQAVDRCHRINSPAPVNVYDLIVKGSIEEKMKSGEDEKGNAADIALDGAPAVFATEEMTMEDLLETARAEFRQDGAVDERLCLEAWPALRQSLAAAWAAQQIQIVGRAA